MSFPPYVVPISLDKAISPTRQNVDLKFGRIRPILTKFA